MQITGTVTLKKISPAGAHYTVNCDKLDGRVGFVAPVGLSEKGTIVIDIPDIPKAATKPPAAAWKPEAKGKK
jgi:hypothetical protein